MIIRAAATKDLPGPLIRDLHISRAELENLVRLRRAYVGEEETSIYRKGKTGFNR